MAHFAFDYDTWCSGEARFTAYLVTLLRQRGTQKYNIKCLGRQVRSFLLLSPCSIFLSLKQETICLRMHGVLRLRLQLRLDCVLGTSAMS